MTTRRTCADEPANLHFEWRLSHCMESYGMLPSAVIFLFAVAGLLFFTILARVGR